MFYALMSDKPVDMLLVSQDDLEFQIDRHYYGMFGLFTTLQEEFGDGEMPEKIKVPYSGDVLERLLCLLKIIKLPPYKIMTRHLILDCLGLANWLMLEEDRYKKLVYFVVDSTLHTCLGMEEYHYKCLEEIQDLPDLYLPVKGALVDQIVTSGLRDYNKIITYNHRIQQLFLEAFCKSKPKPVYRESWFYAYLVDKN